MKTITPSFNYLVLGMIFLTLMSCANVPSYQRMYLNDIDMQFANDGLVDYERSASEYREGCSGGGSGKTGGGCGCN